MPARFEFTPDILTKVENMAGRGATMQQIADALGIVRSTLQKHKAENSDLSDAVKRGRSKGIIAFTDHLYQQSRAGKTAATIFALINLDPQNWKQRPPEAMGGDEAPPPVKIEVAVVDGRVPDSDPAPG